MSNTAARIKTRNAKRVDQVMQTPDACDFVWPALWFADISKVACGDGATRLISHGPRQFVAKPIYASSSSSCL